MLKYSLKSKSFKLPNLPIYVDSVDIHAQAHILSNKLMMAITVHTDPHNLLQLQLHKCL